MAFKTSIKRIVNAPGYHVHPKYDLKALRKRQHGGKHKAPVGDLPLTSMIDMFSMLCIFLLMNFASTGEVFFISKNLKLPEASHSRPIESNPLITITPTSVTLDAESVGDRNISMEEKSGDLEQLRRALARVKELQERLRPDKPFKGNVNIQADENTPILHIKRVMNSLISEGWTGINFAVRLDEKAQQATERVED